MASSLFRASCSLLRIRSLSVHVLPSQTDPGWDRNKSKPLTWVYLHFRDL